MKKGKKATTKQVQFVRTGESTTPCDGKHTVVVTEYTEQGSKKSIKAGKRRE